MGERDGNIENGSGLVRLVEAVAQQLSPPSIDFYWRQQNALYAWLENEISRRSIWPIREAGEPGEIAQELLNELWTHPLCQRLDQKPRMFGRLDVRAGFATFGDVILVPARTLGPSLAEDVNERRKLKADIAHELGHVISFDAEPDVQVKDHRRCGSQRMERRADLIAAHLCGDGGAALAESLEDEVRMRAAFAPLLAKRPWLERVADCLADAFDRRYPPLQNRVNYLQDWTERFGRGEPLPVPKFDFERPPRSRER